MSKNDYMLYMKGNTKGYRQGMTEIGGRIIDGMADIPTEELNFGDEYYPYWYLRGAPDRPQEKYWSGTEWVSKEKFAQLVEDRGIPEPERRFKRITSLDRKMENASEVKTERRKQLEQMIRLSKLPGWAVDELGDFWMFLRLLRDWRTAAFDESGEAIAAMNICKAMDEYYKGTEDVEENDATE